MLEKSWHHLGGRGNRPFGIKMQAVPKQGRKPLVSWSVFRAWQRLALRPSSRIVDKRLPQIHCRDGEFFANSNGRTRVLLGPCRRPLDTVLAPGGIRLLRQVLAHRCGSDQDEFRVVGSNTVFFHDCFQVLAVLVQRHMLGAAGEDCIVGTKKYYLSCSARKGSAIEQQVKKKSYLPRV